MRITHMCEFCLSHIGISNFRKEKESRRHHNYMMLKHKDMCTHWNENAAALMKIHTVTARSVPA